VQGEPKSWSVVRLPKNVIQEKSLWDEDELVECMSSVVFGEEAKKPQIMRENCTKTAVNAGIKVDEKIAQWSENICLLEMENEGLKEKVLGLEKDLEAVGEWREKFETCERQREQYAFEIKKYRKGRVDFQEKVDYLEKSLKNQTNSEKTDERKYSELENLVESLKTQLSAKSDRIKHLERSKIDFDGKIRITTLENASLLTRNKNFELELGTMRDSMVKKSKLDEIDQKLRLESLEVQRQEKKISGLNNEIRMLATENERLCIEIASLRQKPNDPFMELSYDLKLIIIENDSLKQQLQSVTKEKNTARVNAQEIEFKVSNAMSSKIKLVMSESDRLQNILKTKNDELRYSKSQYDELEKAKNCEKRIFEQNLAEKHCELAEFEKVIDECRDHRESLEKCNLDLEMKNCELHRELDLSQNLRKDLESDLQNRNSTIKDLQIQVSTLSQYLDEANEISITKERELQEQSHTSKNLKNLLENYIARLETSQKDLETLKSIIKENNHSIESMGKKNETQKQEILAKTKILETDEVINKNLKDDLAISNNEIGILNQKLADQDGQYENIMESLNDVNSENLLHRKYLDESEKEMRDLEMTITSQKNVIEEWHNKFELKKSEIDNWKSAWEELKSNFRSKELESHELSQKIVLRERD
jgi:chromosome segregation ATPase